MLNLVRSKTIAVHRRDSLDVRRSVCGVAGTIERVRHELNNAAKNVEEKPKPNTRFVSSMFVISHLSPHELHGCSMMKGNGDGIVEIEPEGVLKPAEM